MSYYEYTGGEMPDIDLVMVAKTPAAASTRLLEIRERIREVLSAGGIRAIDYQALQMPSQENPGVPTTPRALWAAEMAMDIDRIFEKVYDLVSERHGAIANQTWRIWCMARVTNSRWTPESIAAVEQLLPRTVRHRVGLVDLAVWDVLEQQEWRIL